MTARHRGALAALLLALGLVVVVWVARDRRPPEWDHANHLERAVDCHRDLAALGRGGLDEILARSSFYPPIVTCAAGDTTNNASVTLTATYTFSIPGIPLGTKTMTATARMRCGG